MNNRPDPARATGPALEAMYRLLLWLVPTVDGFPRSQKFMFGDRIQSHALAVLEALIEATYSRHRDRPLGDANMGLEKLRFLFRLAHDLRHIDDRKYEHAARTIDDVGRMVGGWIKTHHATQS